MSASEVHARLESALRDLRQAEQNAVLWFGEILRRQLYQELGYSSIQAYAAEEHGFTPSKTSQFVRLAGALAELPRLRQSVASGKLGWTKAREVAKVATPESEQQWITEAKRSTSRQLEQKVRASRQQTRRVGPKTGQTTLDLSGRVVDPSPIVTKVTVAVTFTAEQYARYEALLETIRKRASQGGSAVRGMNRAELLLAALNDLAENLETADSNRASTNPPYQVVVYTCKKCEAAEVQTNRGPQPVSAEVVQCDAQIHQPDQPSRSTIPPRIRQAALFRAGHRCETLGCSRTRFLEVHHCRPRSESGGNELENLQVLCSGCHQLAHRREGVQAVRRQSTGMG
ncbi:MAG: HNH endonuclease [bacterium]